MAAISGMAMAIIIGMIIIIATTTIARINRLW